MNSLGCSLGTPLLLCWAVLHGEVGVWGLSWSWVPSVLGSWDRPWIGTSRAAVPRPSVPCLAPALQSWLMGTELQGYLQDGPCPFSTAQHWFSSFFLHHLY